MALTTPWPSCFNSRNVPLLRHLSGRSIHLEGVQTHLHSVVPDANTNVASSYRKSRFRLHTSGTNPITSNSEDAPPPGCSRIKVELRKPLGLILEEDASGNIFVAELAAGGNAEKSGLVEVGDQLIATSAVVYAEEEAYQGVKVRKGMQVVRLNVRGEKFKTVIAAIGTHPGYMPVALKFQKCKPRDDNGGL